MLLEISQNSQENTVSQPFFNTVAALSPAALLKRDSGTSIFLWILQNF